VEAVVLDEETFGFSEAYIESLENELERALERLSDEQLVAMRALTAQLERFTLMLDGKSGG
jgi:hypothetical protein